MRVGSLEIQPVLDGTATMPVAESLRYVGDVADPFAPHRQFLNEDGKTFDIPLGGFLVRTGDRVVLVDAGAGDLVRPPFYSGRLLESLAELGTSPSDITDVVFTHLHFDHVGWATSKGRVVFENATYRCHRADWAHFVEGDGGAARKLGPVLDRMEFWEQDTTVAPGIDVTGAPGHTPGSTIVIVSNGGEQALLLGDVVHCPFELMEDDWEALFDVDPGLARETRAALAREIEGRDIPVAGAHFPGMQFGRLLPGEGRRSWRF